MATARHITARDSKSYLGPIEPLSGHYRINIEALSKHPLRLGAGQDQADRMDINGSGQSSRQGDDQARIPAGVAGSAPRIELRHVRKTYPARHGSVPALADITLHATESEFVSLIGPSGCGKSTLFTLIAGLAEPSAGEILLRGESLASRTGRVGYMPQKDLLMPWRTVLDNVTLGPELRGQNRDTARRDALGHFDAFGLAGFEHRYPAMLSGGMRQRAALLRTVLLGSDLLLLDEPFGALDALTRADMQEWLLGIWEATRPTVLFITHDVDEALILSDRVYVLTERPAAIRAEVTVSLPRPRDYRLVATPEFAALKARLLGALRPSAGALPTMPTTEAIR